MTTIRELIERLETVEKSFRRDVPVMGRVGQDGKVRELRPYCALEHDPETGGLKSVVVILEPPDRVVKAQRVELGDLVTVPSLGMEEEEMPLLQGAYEEALSRSAAEVSA